MLNLLNKIFGNKKPEAKTETTKETFTSIEMRETLEAWTEAVESKCPISKILIVNNKQFSSHKRGEVLNVEWYEGEYIKGYKEITVGGVFPVPTKIEDLEDSNMLYVPYFEDTTI